MLFHTLEFAFFFAIVFTLYRLTAHKVQNRLLLVASYIFYGAWDWRYLSLILISTTVDYLCARYIEDSESPATRTRLVGVSVLVNLTLLGVFKYYDFFAHSFKEFAGNFGVEVSPFILNVILPVGISFYTFQTMSYTLDVYRKKLPAARHFLDFALYVSFFPQLIAGPIERGTRLLPQVLNPRTISWGGLLRGSYLFLWGVFLKVVIGDNMAKLVDPVFAAAPPYEGLDVLIAVYAFSFQIYADFAGYSFMAIGIAATMGFTLMENFRRPYFSKNISEFWRRWHISLSSWFRDYFFSPCYISLQKSRWLVRTPILLKHGIAFFITLLVTEFMLGLWHGAAWHYGFFGLYHGAAILAYYYTKKYWDRMPVIIQIFLMFHVACGGWLVFRAESLSMASEMASALVTNFNFVYPSEFMIILSKVALPLVILLIIQFFQDSKNDTLVVISWPSYLKYPFYCGLVLLIVGIGDLSDRPFLYFQF